MLSHTYWYTCISAYDDPYFLSRVIGVAGIQSRITGSLEWQAFKCIPAHVAAGAAVHVAAGAAVPVGPHPALSSHRQAGRASPPRLHPPSCRAPPPPPRMAPLPALRPPREPAGARSQVRVVATARPAPRGWRRCVRPRSRGRRGPQAQGPGQHPSWRLSHLQGRKVQRLDALPIQINSASRRTQAFRYEQV